MSRKAAKRRPMVNGGVYTDPRDPNGWGAADPLPMGRKREDHLPIWEKMLRDYGAGNEKGNEAWFTPEMLQAGGEIGRVFIAVSGALMPRSQMGERVSGGMRADWSDSQLIAYKDRYVPWARAMEAHAFQAGEPVHGILIDLAVEDISLAEAFQRHGVGHRRGVKLVQYGLGMYVLMAGWGRRKK